MTTDTHDPTPATEPLALRLSDGLAVTPPRVVCQFSCGAASAVATKLALAKYGATHEVAIINAFIVEEGEDNRRFLADCEQWFGRTVTVLRDEKYGASTYELWKRKRFMVSHKGAPCSRELKRKLLDEFRRPDDIVIFGFTAEERDRYDDFVERYPEIHAEALLIDANLDKAACLAMVERAGILLPVDYLDGFNNANCSGECPKGGMGHWNRMRVVRPAGFARMMAAQEDIGPGSYFFRNRKTGERFGLKDLPPDAGRHDEPLPACGFFCELAEQTYSP